MLSKEKENAILYLLNLTEHKRLSRHELFKALYSAQKYALEKYGIILLADTFVAMDYGPVPSQLYDEIKGQQFYQMGSFDKKETGRRIEALKPADLDYLSEVEVEALKFGYESIQGKSFTQRSEDSHDSAWKKAYDPQKPNNPIPIFEIAKAAGLTEEECLFLLDY